jgi:hypothetical protein
LIKADTKATSKSKISMNLRYPYLQNLPNESEACSINLQRFKEALITNIAAIVRGASFEKTPKIWGIEGQLSLISKPENNKIIPNKVRAVVSTLTFSIKKEIRADNKSPNAKVVSHSID